MDKGYNYTQVKYGKNGNTCLKPEMTRFRVEIDLLDDKRSYNLLHFKWKMKTTPPPYFNDEKMASFNLYTDLPLMLGGGGC